MAENQLLFGLKRKYGQTLGLIRAGHDLADDLAHVGAVILMFRPDTDLTAIRAIRPSRPDRREWARVALDILRREGRPMAARELARRVILSEGGDLATLPSGEACLHGVLGRLEGQGVIRVEGTPKRWSVG